MSSVRRLLLPIILAASCVAVLVGGLLWYLKTSTNTFVGSLTTTITLQADAPSIIETIDPRDTALMAMRQGDIKALQGEWTVAKDAYRRAVDANGGLPALRKLAQAQLQLGEKDELADTIEKMRAAGATGDDIQLLEVIIALRAGDFAAATAGIAALTPDSPQAHYAGALLAILQGDHQRATDELAAVRAGSEPLLKGSAAVLQSAYDEFALFPDSPNIHLVTLLGRALAQIEECPLALPLLRQVTQVQRDYRDAWVVQGFCELAGGQSVPALNSLSNAYGIDPEKPEIQYYLGRAYSQNGDHHNAVTFLTYALKNGFRPERIVREALLNEATAAQDAVAALDQAEALAALDDATLADAERAVDLAIKAPDLPAALAIAQAATSRWPTDGRSFDLLGIALQAADRKDEARHAFEQALTLNPNLQSASDRLQQL